MGLGATGGGGRQRRAMDGGVDGGLSRWVNRREEGWAAGTSDVSGIVAACSEPREHSEGQHGNSHAVKRLPG